MLEYFFREPACRLAGAKKSRIRYVDCRPEAGADLRRAVTVVQPAKTDN